MPVEATPDSEVTYAEVTISAQGARSRNPAAEVGGLLQRAFERRFAWHVGRRQRRLRRNAMSPDQRADVVSAGICGKFAGRAIIAKRFGGPGRNRTDVRGFAVLHCMATLPPGLRALPVVS